MPMSEKPQRHRLIDRRQHFGREIEWNNGDQASRVILGGIGTDRDGRVRELWADRSEKLKEGNEVLALASDACLLASLLLQHGYTAAELLAKLMKAPDGNAERHFRDRDTGIARPSIIAKLLAEAAEFERDFGAWVAWMHGRGPMPEVNSQQSGEGAAALPAASAEGTTT
jgi:hypothetical protein